MPALALNHTGALSKKAASGWESWGSFSANFNFDNKFSSCS